MAVNSLQGRIKSTKCGLRPIRGGFKFLIEPIAIEAPLESMKSLPTPSNCLN